MSSGITLETGIRAVECAVLALHSVIGFVEPFTGLLAQTFQDKGAMPKWFFPAAGVLHATFAYLNFFGNEAMILVAQAYIASFHLGASFFHVRLGHHPLTFFAPSGFPVFAFVVTALRTNVWWAILGLIGCIALAAFLTWLLVNPPSNHHDRPDSSTPLFFADNKLSTSQTTETIRLS
ncbi:unnamed protein product [Cylindrotheca closterium]|uniref:Uncharacterized protein n=1 Tax=Cylindrotheca closterium TaxID=2856 RepID=A0AAD2CIW2_9STRA|nr:unnamed protein product [Cylindrotheca closterium]